MAGLAASLAAGLTAAVTRLPPAARRGLLYRKAHGRFPDRRTPERFTEKVDWRIVYDRRPELAWTCDKLAMKRRAAGIPGVHVPRTLWTGTDPARLRDHDLPSRWVLKPNHRSGLVHFGQGPVLSGPDLAAGTRGWLAAREADRLAEWAYSLAEPALLVEEFVSDDGRPPTDYKILVFGGRPRYVQVDTDRFGDHRRNFYDASTWRDTGARQGCPRGPVCAPPDHLDDMLRAAAAIAGDLDFLRVDFYVTAGEGLVFGETSPYPLSGLSPFVPAGFDRTLGAQWTLPDLSGDPAAPGSAQ